MEDNIILVIIPGITVLVIQMQASLSATQEEDHDTADAFVFPLKLDHD